MQVYGTGHFLKEPKEGSTEEVNKNVVDALNK
jgi:hypothetical protein